MEAQATPDPGRAASLINLLCLFPPSPLFSHSFSKKAVQKTPPDPQGEELTRHNPKGTMDPPGQIDPPPSHPQHVRCDL